MSDLRLARPITLFAPAKLNLGLEVVGRRSDGYHEVVTILQTVSVFDRIMLEPASELLFSPTAGIPNEDDLTIRAIQGAQDEFDISLAARGKLDKNIPVAAGMGGGSSDAGTMLGAMMHLAGKEPEFASKVAADLGSDVPFFLTGGTALATGTGTTIEQLPTISRLWFVVLVPQTTIPNKTATLYRELAPVDYGDGSATLAQVERVQRGENLDTSLLRNSFARPLLEREPVRKAVEALHQAGADTVLPTGAGPAVFATFDTWATAADVYHRLQHQNECAAYICTTLDRDLNRARVIQARSE